MLFSELLKNYNPKHTIQEELLFTEFSCGCKTSISYGNNLKGMIPLSVRGGNLWYNSSQCKEHTRVDLSEFGRMRFKSAMAIVTEIYGFNSIALALGEKCNLKIKRGNNEIKKISYD